MAKNLVRVEIPSDPTAVLVLAGKIDAESKRLGDASPLNSLEDAVTFPVVVSRATKADSDADDFAKKAETAMGARKADMPAVLDGVRARRDALLAAYRSNPKKLTEFGFEVSDSVSSNGGSAPAPSPNNK